MSIADIQALLKEEKERQQGELSLIASENYVSRAVLEASASVLTNKYSEGYPGRRYYGGNEIADEVEQAAQEAAKRAFHTDYHVNVQPYAGSTANIAAYAAVLQPGDTVLSLSLAHGGHLTHGHTVSYSGAVYNFIHYGVSKDTGLLDYEEIAVQAKAHRPKLIVAGGSAYPMLIDWVAFSRIARESQSLLMVDMAHIAGLIAGNVHPSPFGHADIITTTTQKTLRGPRGGMIFCKPELASAIDKAVFPGVQGGPHMHTIAAKAIALTEAQEPSFTAYAKQVVSNAKALAYALQQLGYSLVADGTETHLMLVDLRGSGVLGKEAQRRLESVGITTNKNLIPYDDQSALSPSGLRLGTAAITTRGMKESEMQVLAECIHTMLTEPQREAEVAAIVAKLARKFRVPGL